MTLRFVHQIRVRLARAGIGIAKTEPNIIQISARNTSLMDPTSSQQSGSTRTGSLLVIFLTVFIDLLGFGIVLPLLPLYADQYGTDPSGWVIGMLMASFSIMQFLFAPIWGSLSDRVGRRPIIMVGLAGSVIFYTLFGMRRFTKVWPDCSSRGSEQESLVRPFPPPRRTSLILLTTRIGHVGWH